MKHRKCDNVMLLSQTDTPQFVSQRTVLFNSQSKSQLYTAVLSASLQGVQLSVAEC